MTKTQRKILDLMRELVNQGSWQRVSGGYSLLTIRKTQEIETPDYHRAVWDEDTYSRHLFLGLTTSGVILGDAPAPWIGRRDSDEPYWLVLMLLETENPFSVLDRRPALKAERRKAARL